MSTRTLQLTDKLYDYLLTNSLRELPVMKQLRRETAKLPMAVMQISPEQAQFMSMLIKISGARKALEIGTYTGYSSIAVADALPADGKLVACDIDPENTKIAQRFWEQAGLAHKIDLRIAPVLKTLDDLINHGEENTFDFVFIDADKPAYDEYYEKSLRLVRKGGLITFDNTFLGGKVADTEQNSDSVVAMRVLNKKLHEDSRVTISMLPISDGFTIARKR